MKTKYLIVNIVVLCAAVSFLYGASYTVPIGSSSLINSLYLDYSESFSTDPNLYRNNTDEFATYQSNTPNALLIETAYGTNPIVSWYPWTNDAAGTKVYFRDTNRSKTDDFNPMADQGCLETGPGYGGHSASIPYGIRTRFVVQVDTIMTPGRIDIVCGGPGGYWPAGGGTGIWFFTNMVYIGANAVGFEQIPVLNPHIMSYQEWHNLALVVDTVAKTIEIYVDEALLGSLDLNTFSGGKYAPYLGNETITIGSGNDTQKGLFDNFQVGSFCEPIASNPYPENGQAYVPLDQDLSWDAGCDPNVTGPGYSHHVIFTTDPDVTANPNAVVTAIVSNGITTWDAGTLNAGTTYHWRIDEVQGASVYTGDVWSFITVGAPPYMPSPTNGATGVDVNADLSWQAGAGGPYTYDVYLGLTPDNLQLVSPNQPGLSYDPSKMLYNTTYYWEVIANDGANAYSGGVWSFSTFVPNCNPVPVADLTGDCKVDLSDFAVMASEWLGCNLIPVDACWN